MGQSRFAQSAQGSEPPWESRLRTGRTLFVHRWHAAQTIGEWFGNEEVGVRFEHINHARSLAQYVWRHGAFRETDDGTGREPHPAGQGAPRAGSSSRSPTAPAAAPPTLAGDKEHSQGLEAIVRPVARKGRRHFARAVRHAERFGDQDPPRPGDNPPDDIRRFARRLTALHRAMLPWYVQMRFLTQAEASHYRRSPVPILGPLLGRPRAAARADATAHPPPATDATAQPGSPDGATAHPPPAHPPPAGDSQAHPRRAPDDDLPDDLSEALLGAFARNIHQALCCRARSELFETLVAHGDAASPVAIEVSPGGQAAAPAAHGRAHDAQRGHDAHGSHGSHRAPAPRGPSLRDRTLTRRVIVQGRRRVFAVRDPALRSMLASLDEKPFPTLFRWLAAFKMAVSTMITAMPVFIVKNFFRDTLAGFVAGRYPTMPFVGTLAGSVEAVRELVTGRSEPLRQYLLQGGFYSGLVESETHMADVRDGAGRLKRHAAARRAWSRLAHWATRPAWISEAGTRVDQYQRAIRAGATPYAAGRAARMVSSDFANIGSSRGWRMYVHTVPFLNAALQGLDQLYQIYRRPRRASPRIRRRTQDQRAHMRKVARSGAWLAAMSCAVWAFNGSTGQRREAYLAETDYEKASWVTFYDVAGETDLRIPVPFQIGAAFIKLPEVAFDLAARRETLAGPKFVWSLVHGNLSVGVVPAVLQPWVDIYRNRNFFGSEIIPAYMANWEPEDQFFDRSTPLPYRSVGAALNVSPLHVQTVWRAWTGHLGNLGATALDDAMWDEDQNGAKPFARTGRLLTGVHSLQPPRPRTNTRYSNEFYDISDWASGRARRESCQSGARVPAVCLARTIASRASREASQLRRDGDAIRSDRNMSRAAKERELEAVYAQVNGVLQSALPDLRRLRRLGSEPVQLRDFPAAAAGGGGAAQRRVPTLPLPTLPTLPTPTLPTLQRAPSPGAGAGHRGPCPPGTVDVNSAGLAQLDRIPGIGPALAQRIVDERRANGRFRSYAELQRVRGIGPRTVERMRDMACAG